MSWHHMQPHPEAGALLLGLGKEEGDIVHTERDYIAAAVLTSVPDNHHEGNRAEEDHKMDWWTAGAEVGVDNGVNHYEEHLE